MFWNDPEHCLESIILIENEDDILSIPRQIQLYCICLGLSKANKPVSLYRVHTNCWKPVQVYCVHTLQLNSSQAGPESRRTWERTIDRPSYTAVGEALKPSVQSIPLHRLSQQRGPRDCSPPSCAAAEVCV
jgi:hypothetical protein